MSFLRLLILIIGIYFAYRFVFYFLLPVYRTSKRMHQQFKGMQDTMNQHMHTGADAQQPQEPANNRPSGSAVNKKDYIDFEEIRWIKVYYLES